MNNFKSQNAYTTTSNYHFRPTQKPPRRVHYASNTKMENLGVPPGPPSYGNDIRTYFTAPNSKPTAAIEPQHQQVELFQTMKMLQKYADNVSNASHNLKLSVCDFNTGLTDFGKTASRFKSEQESLMNVLNKVQETEAKLFAVEGKNAELREFSEKLLIERKNNANLEKDKSAEKLRQAVIEYEKRLENLKTDFRLEAETGRKIYMENVSLRKQSKDKDQQIVELNNKLDINKKTFDDEIEKLKTEVKRLEQQLNSANEKNNEIINYGSINLDHSDTTTSFQAVEDPIQAEIENMEGVYLSIQTKKPLLNAPQSSIKQKKKKILFKY